MCDETTSLFESSTNDYNMILLHELGVDEDMIHEMELVKMFSTNAVIYIRETDLEKIADVTKEKISEIVEDIYRNNYGRLPTVLRMDDDSGNIELYVQPKNG